MIESNNHEHGQTIGMATSGYYHPQLDSCISRSNDFGLMGGVIFQQYLKASVQVHVASFQPGWMSRDLLWAIFDYAFDVLGVLKIIGITPSTNPAATRFNDKIGMVEETRILDAVPGGDFIVYSMYRSECRWLTLKPRSICRITPEGKNEQHPVNPPAAELRATGTGF